MWKQRLAWVATVALLLASHAQAVTFNVNSTVDEVDALPGDGVCATASGACTLRAAIQETNALAGEDTIEVPAGDFVLTIPGTGEDAAATGDLDITDDLSLTGAGVNETIIDAAGLDHLLHLGYVGFGGVGMRVQLEGVTATGGEATDSLAGAIYVEPGGFLSIIDSAVKENFGNGIASVYGKGLVISGSVVEENSGHGVFCYWCSGATIEDSTIRANGGGVSVGEEGSLIVRDSVITENNGRGLSVGEMSSARVERSTVSNNEDTGVNVWTGDALISNSVINGNRSESGAGGISIFRSPVSVTNTTISGNAGLEGGGVALFEGGLRISNSTITDNYAARRGGGISGVWGGLPIMGLETKNSIVAKNSAFLDGPDCSTWPESAPITSAGHNILGDATDCDFTSTPSDQVGAAPNPMDPLLGPLADNGGPTLTHALLPGSPAIDSVPVADCTYNDSRWGSTPDVPLTSDQRGVSRPQRVACDVGAYELEPTPTPTPTASPTASPTPSPTPTPTPLPVGDLPMCKSKRGKEMTVLVPLLKLQRSLDKGLTMGECPDASNGVVMCKSKRGKMKSMVVPHGKVQRSLDKGLTMGVCREL